MAQTPQQEALVKGREHIAMLCERQGLDQEAREVRAGQHDHRAGVVEMVQAALDGEI